MGLTRLGGLAPGGILLVLLHGLVPLRKKPGQGKAMVVAFGLVALEEVPLVW